VDGKKGRFFKRDTIVGGEDGGGKSQINVKLRGKQVDQREGGG